MISTKPMAMVAVLALAGVAPAQEGSDVELRVHLDPAADLRVHYFEVSVEG